ncbi:hypothetical protein AAFC00_000618 [Neodothiora populina]|uniref:Magnesium chelatase n=1 Tax=Neodothiora populina TaxID=2781224 RepID=A0ABR3PEP4_9PEZI
MDSIALRIQPFGDLELAILLSLVAEQHCIITTQHRLLDDVAQNLRLISSQVFGLTCVVVDCSASTTLDNFREGVLVDCPSSEEDHRSVLSPVPSSHASRRQSLFRHESGLSNTLDERRVANIVVTKDLNLASHNVQTQALELIRTRRLFSHTAMHAASKDFLFVSLQISSSPKLSRHLNDLFAISHHHSSEDTLYESNENVDYTATSIQSLAVPSEHLKRHSDPKDAHRPPVINHTDISHLRAAAAKVKISAEVATYLHNVALFLRLSRFVSGGVTALATLQFRSIVRALAPLHDLTYCPPSLVALAARKVYPHRLILATATTESSLQWGSDPKAVSQLLEGMTAEDAIEDTLSSVQSPL